MYMTISRDSFTEQPFILGDIQYWDHLPDGRSTVGTTGETMDVSAGGVGTGAMRDDRGSDAQFPTMGFDPESE